MQKILSKYKVKFRDYKAASQDEREIADWIVTDLTFGYYDPAEVESAKFSRQMSGKSGLMNLVITPNFSRSPEKARITWP